MSTPTIRLPDDKHLRLRELARRRSMSINKLMEELATISITEFDAETRFRAVVRAANCFMTATYWEVGRRIVEFEQGGKRRAELWG